jgi:hypothetical protein
MFLRFWTMYRRTLDHSFDTNIYCVPMFAAEGIHPALRPRCAVLAQGGTAVFVTATAEYPTVLPAAAAKLLLASAPAAVAKDLPRVSALLAAAAKFKKSLDAELAAAIRATPAAAGDTKAARRTHALYSLQCAHGAAALQMLYAPPEARVSAAALLASLVRALFFAVEAYFTPDAVNVVVVGLQRRERVQCEPLSYVCSALENLGDLRTHVGDGQEKKAAGGRTRKRAAHPVQADPRRTLLKFSKYVHRILHSLEGFGARAFQRASWYEEHVLPHRASGDVDRVPWAAAGYVAGVSVDAFVGDLTVQVLRAVEAFLEAQDMRF